jgi:alkyl sulfatase BDS1-like metallo-beta-lactamase superfamily hydrolase
MPVHSLIYTHGHVDHVGGSGAVAADAAGRGFAPPRVIGHDNVPVRMQRYEDTNGWNLAINARQFGGISRQAGMGIGGTDRFLPADALWPDTTFSRSLALSVGGLDLELHHGRGETDDHAWAWVPSRRALCVGDFVTWVFPNAGNPQKVQRYPLEWARALREMAAYEPELLVPAHGLPIGGVDRIRTVLDDVATALESLLEQTLQLMNDGATLDQVLQTVRLPASLLDKPYLAPSYDEPEFVVRNIWRLYGGWYDGNPSRLKPPSDNAIAMEMATLLGGTEPLIRKAIELRQAGELRLAAHFIELAVLAEPDNANAHKARARIYKERRYEELSLMAQGIFGYAAKQSERLAEQLDEQSAARAHIG